MHKTRLYILQIGLSAYSAGRWPKRVVYNIPSRPLKMYNSNNTLNVQLYFDTVTYTDVGKQSGL